MPDINRSADLTEYLQERDSRLRKVERQLSVTRTAYSSVSTSETTASTTAGGVALTTADTITVVPTTRSIIYFYVEVTIANTGANNGQVFLYDVTGVKSYQVIDYAGTGPATLAAVPGSIAGTTTSSTFGGFLSTFVATAGPRDYSLRYRVTAGTGTFSNRRLYAWIQPF